MRFKKRHITGGLAQWRQLARRQFCGKLARYYPAASSVKAATAPSRWDVVCKRTSTPTKQ